MKTTLELRKRPVSRTRCSNPRHCEPTGRRQRVARMRADDRLREAIRKEPDCFVAEFIIGPAKGRTRWLLAMTAALLQHAGK